MSCIQDLCYFGVDIKWVKFAYHLKVVKSFSSVSNFKKLEERYNAQSRLWMQLAETYCGPDSIPIWEMKMKLMIKNFRQFITQYADSRGFPICPTHEIMFVWYCYTLHPEIYYKDCMEAFGWVPEFPFSRRWSTGNIVFQKQIPDDKCIKPSIDLKIDIKKRIEKSWESYQLCEQNEYETTLARYLAFLTIIKNDRKEGRRLVRVPPKDIDQMWHAHLAAPVEYNQFCQEVFGELLNHTPGYDKHMHEDAKTTESEFKKILPHDDYVLDFCMSSYEEYFYDDGCG